MSDSQDRPEDEQGTAEGRIDDERTEQAGAGAGTPRPPRRDRQRLEHELDELHDTVTELRDEINALRTARGAGPQDATGTPAGGPPSLAELHEQLYRDATSEDDPGGDIVMLLRLTGEHSAALQELDTRKPVLPCWAEMDSEQAAKAWEQLVDWLCGVLILRYPTSARTLRPCWYLHPELVENLSWLHNAWTLAYRDGNSPISMAADWHLYWLPHVMRTAGEATRKCYDAGRHDPSSDPDLTADNAVGISDDLTAHVRADLRNRPEPDDPNTRGYVVPPVPTRAPRPWTGYRRPAPAEAAAPGAGHPPHGPGPATPAPNPYQAHRPL